MTIEEYLRIASTAKMEIEVNKEVKAELIDAVSRVKGIDYSKEKLQGGQVLDLTDRLAKVFEETDKIDKINLELAETIVETRELIESLKNSTERTVMKRRYILRQTFETIAEELDIHEKTVRRYHKKAVDKLRHKFKK